METFWGASVVAGKDLEVDVSNAAVHIAQACLDPKSKGSATLFVKTTQFKSWMPLCTLSAGTTHARLDHTFFPGDEAFFVRVVGQGSIAITGSYRRHALPVRVRTLTRCCPFHRHRCSLG